MRVDHYAYQRAARVAGFGLGLQLLIGLILLLFGLMAPTDVFDEEPLRGDTAFYFASLYVLLGVPVWLSLLVVFQQHKLERLEALEHDEIASQGASIFDEDESRVAARRLRLMHHWLMPIASLLIAGALAFLATRMLGRLDAAKDDPNLFLMTNARGWAIAVCLAGTLISFIFSRYVAGMAKQLAWHNLRGGAGFMVGNAFVMVLVAVGVAFRFFENDAVIEGIAYAIPGFLILLGAEIVFNFILHLYRPRVPGDVPRPAFDSRVLGMLAAPDSLVKSINEAVNYQFGFDITSSWGYQLLLRSFLWLIGFGVAVMLALSMMTVVEPHEQAVRLRSGERVGSILESGLAFKWPWPLESIETYNVGRVRRIPITAIRTERPDINLWGEELKKITDVDPEPFLVQVSRVQPSGADRPGGDDATRRAERDDVSGSFSLVDAEVFVEYRIKRDPDEGLDKWLSFAPETMIRSRRMTMAQLALRAIASAELTRHLSGLDMDEILATQRGALSEALRDRIQRAFDDAETGAEVVSVTIPVLRPPFDLTTEFEDITFAKQERIQRVDEANQRVETGLAMMVGDLEMADRVFGEILAWERIADELGTDHPDAVAKRLEIKRMLFDAGGEVASLIEAAEKDRWVKQIDALTRVKSFEGKIVAFHAAPEIYRQREIMDIVNRQLIDKPKFVLGVDPAGVNIDIELKETASVFDLSRSIQNGEGNQ